MDWKKLKTEYIAGGTSYRKLAKKYNVPLGTLRRVAKDGNWVGLRAQTEIETDTKIVNSVSDKNAKQAELVTTIANKLLTKLGEAIDLVDVIDSQTFKQYTSALKDLKDIKGIKSESDMREQEARIANLRKQAERDEESKDVKVTLAEDLDEYSQ